MPLENENMAPTGLIASAPRKLWRTQGRMYTQHGRVWHLPRADWLGGKVRVVRLLRV